MDPYQTSIRNFGPAKPPKGTLSLPLTMHDAHVILRALAVANDATMRAGEKVDVDARTWIAERLLRIVEANR